MGLKNILLPFLSWKHVFDKPVCIDDPVRERTGADRYRGFHKNDLDKCVGCGSCKEICQNKAIDLTEVDGYDAKDGDSGLRLMIDYGRCCWCALCVDICPTGSLTMSNEFIWVDNDPEVYRFVPGRDGDFASAEKGYKKAEGYMLNEPQRIKMMEEEAGERIKSFIEVVKGYSKEQALKEADRCVSCGICVATCPAHMNIPEYIKAIRDDDMEKGLQILYETNPLPEICGRICTRRCEEACVIGHQGEAVAIRWLKRYIADMVPFEDYKRILKAKDLPEKDKKVAIVGAGAAGLACAYYLATMGYSITVFEESAHAGGALYYGIPKYRLPENMLDKDIELITSMGVDIRYNTKVGRDIAFDDIYRQYDALFLAPGMGVSSEMSIPGEDSPGVYLALDFLKRVNSNEQVELGSSVIVIGGGNTAMDAARISARLAESVKILYRRREEDMPADYEEIHDSKAEKVEIIDKAIPIEIRKNGNGKLILKWGRAEMVQKEPGKRPSPVLIEDQIFETEADNIISAIGQYADYSFINEDINKNIKYKRYKMQVDAFGRTSDPKIFAGGDTTNSVADAISAIADGHRAARGIDRFLS